MKATEAFKTTIEAYLNQRAADDELFAKTLKKEGKNITDCITYIMNTVQKSGCNGFTDAEVFGWAVHYYDEDDIKVVSDPKSSVRVVVNHVVELSQAEKDEAHKKALARAIDEAQAKITKKPVAKTPPSPTSQPSLF